MTPNSDDAPRSAEQTAASVSYYLGKEADLRLDAICLTNHEASALVRLLLFVASETCPEATRASAHALFEVISSRAGA